MIVVLKVLEGALADFDQLDLSEESDCELDSLALAQLIIYVEKEYGIKIPLKDALQMSTVKGAYRVIESLGSKFVQR